jgi:D-glycerate 3-kinase
VSNDVEFCIFEGWFVGLNGLHLTAEDNAKLLQDPLSKFSQENLEAWNNFDFLDSLVVIKPQDFNYSIEWRKEQENRDNDKGMTPEQVEDFVNYFFRSINPEIYYRGIVARSDVLAELNFEREVQSLVIKG